MKLYSIKNGKISGIVQENFKLEKDIQIIVEQNLGELLNLQFVGSEISMKNFRIDTLGFDKENRSFVIIEYKRQTNFSVIDQGYTYLSLMLNNKADFILEYNERYAEALKRDDVDWSQSRVIFISTGYTDYQKHSVNFKDVPFELWEIKKYQNNFIGLTEHKTTSDVSISTITKDPENVVSKVNKEVKVYTEDGLLYAVKNRTEWVVELYKDLRERILKLGEVEIKPTGLYISFRRKNPFTDIIIYQQGLVLVINMKADTLNDPNHVTEKISDKGHWGNGDYRITIKEDSDLDYIMFLVNQSYKVHE